MNNFLEGLVDLMELHSVEFQVEDGLLRIYQVDDQNCHRIRSVDISSGVHNDITFSRICDALSYRKRLEPPVDPGQLLGALHSREHTETENPRRVLKADIRKCGVDE